MIHYITIPADALGWSIQPSQPLENLFLELLLLFQIWI